MKRGILVVLALALCTGMVFGQTQIEFWHAMTGKNGAMVQSIADKFNATQSKYKVVPVFKGSYSDTMNAGIAAFRAKQAPAIIRPRERSSPSTSS